MTIWAPVIAALGASLLTGFFGFGGIWWQQQRLNKAAETQREIARLPSAYFSFTVLCYPGSHTA